MIDISLLRQIMGNDEARVRRFLGIFASEVPKQIRSLQLALDQRNLEEISTIAHALKSQVRYLSETAIASLAAEIEEQADTGFYSV
ncbi:MAG: Hpt domain-containing protein, partial [Saprospiraceae bacterium]|nr:Hpt domain-containing protein [Saprospiraceae bacterium]